MPSDGRVQAQTSFSGAGSSIDKRHFAISHRAIVVVFIFSHVRLFARESDRLSRPEYWSGEPFHSPGDLPHPGIEPRSPALQAGALPAEPQEKPKDTGVGSLSLLQRIFLTHESNRGLLHCR